jgi:caffeoyl-CoA O-methyltransferase
MPAPKTVAVTPEVHEYLLAHSVPVDDVQRDLIERTRALGGVSGMQIAPEQGAFMTLLARLIGATRAIEVGTFTGYSSLAIARGLPADGHLLCCDVSEEWTAIARDAWQRAGVADRIQLEIGPGIDTLRALPPDAVIDLAFIDADKPSYPAYYEELLLRLRPNGVLLVDNVLWSGAVADPSVHDENTDAIRAFNDMVAADARVEAVMLPISDGLTLVRKKEGTT